MNSVLDYFISLQESQSADMNEQSVEMWNRRAEFWENARKKNHSLSGCEKWPGGQGSQFCEHPGCGGSCGVGHLLQ